MTKHGKAAGGDGWLARRRAKRARKKARIAAMSTGARWTRRGLIAGTWVLGALAAVLVAAIAAFYAFSNVPRPESLPLPQVATIEYSNGAPIAEIGVQDRTIVSLDQVPPTVRWAVLAAEDRNFYNDSVVSLRGTARAALSDIGGGSTQGGSGITQQYVKNAYLNDAQTLTRKLKELMIAVKLSRQYSKDDILEFYLNTVYFGRGAYGIQAAAKVYFGEDVSKLDTAQGAVLAGLLRAPSYYDPAENPTVAQQRWHYVLDGMVQTGHLNAEQEAQLRYPKTRKPTGDGLGSTGWKYLLVQRVLADLSAHGITEKEIYKRGLHIRTTIDQRAQQDAVDAIHTEFKHLTKKQRNLKNALVAVRPSDGAVLAYWGGQGPDVKGYDGKISEFDYASLGGRPPGSSFKPYTLATVLGQTLKRKALSDHIAINTPVDGSFCAKIEGTKICNDPGDQSVSSSHVTVANAMKYSLNTTFDLLADRAGPNQVATTAHRMGIPTHDSYGTPTLVGSNGQTNFGIGIGDYPVTPLAQASGFATLENHGKANPPYFVESATASNGSSVYKHKDTSTQAIDSKVANDVTLTLKPVAAYSNAGLADGRESAAKTGTEGIGTKTRNNSDAWMVGFTPQVSTAMWVGSGSNKPIFNADGNPLYGSNLPAQTWKLFMDDYLKNAKHEKLASRQMISSDGSTIPAPSTQTYTPPPTLPPTTSEHTRSPKPTFSISTGFSSSSAPPPTTSAPPTVSVPPTTSRARPTPPRSATCTPGLVTQC